MAFSTSIFPFISKKTDVGNQTYGYLALKYSFFLIVPLSLIGVLNPSALLNLLFPVEYQEASIVLAVISCATLMQVLAQVMGTVFQAEGRPVTPAVSWATAALIQILLIVPLTRLWGMEGAAISSLIASFVLLASLMFYYQKEFHLRLNWLWVFKVIVVGIICGSILLVFPNSSRALFFIALVISSVAYLVLLLMFNLISSRDIDILSAGLPKHRLSEALIYAAKVTSSVFGLKEPSSVISGSISSAEIPARQNKLPLYDLNAKLTERLSNSRLGQYILLKFVNRSLFVLLSSLVTLGVIVGLPDLWDWTFGPILLTGSWVLIASLLYRWSNGLAFAIAIVLLGIVVGLLIMDKRDLAENVGIAAFYYLSLGISLSFLRLILRGTSIGNY
ncbi:hypothetical protein FIM02_01970 [SAR202 cluster bacterium AD-802-E10_MRT_200m]|nr:hypothetical protein [SAR202 cluster bacterium AD-802-E10_MRT_200m]MQF82913.1 hypothetical protein [SAR202 cluster bacterium AD-802-E10_MRT_200m]